MIWFLNTFPIFRYTLPVFPIHWFICGVWLRWINMSTTRFKIKTWHGCFIWMYLWRKPTVFRKFPMAFSFYLIKLLSWAEQLRLQPLPGKPLVLPLSQRLLQAENQIARHDVSIHIVHTCSRMTIKLDLTCTLFHLKAWSQFNPCASIKSYTWVHSGQKCPCQKNGHKNWKLGSTELSLVSF